jgi:hypothetical protein
MSYIVPGTGVLWYFRTDAEQRMKLLGTPLDCMMKFKMLEEKRALSQGLEISLIPNKLRGIDDFEPWFYSQFSKLKYKSVHIGDMEPEFLTSSKCISEKLDILSKMLKDLEVDTVIIHAHHFQHEPIKVKKVLDAFLPHVEIYIENNGFGSGCGSRVDDLIQIFNDCPEFKLCLDICHIKDHENFTFDDFVSVDALRDRIKQIHFSYSSRLEKENLYANKGYINYDPHHALWSIIGKTPSSKTKEFIRQYPVILEGVIPREDSNLAYLKKEVELLDS